MINIKRNSKGDIVKANGIRSKSSSKYVSNQTEIFRISRSKFNDFLNCKRCFYLDRVIGLITPSQPGWTLNETTDLLLKKEFDECRKKQIPHRIFPKYGLTHVVPFDHLDIDDWRNSLKGGLEYHIPNTNIIFFGGVDDIWFDTNTKELIVIDYKSQASRHEVNVESYLSDIYHQSYKIQLEVYAYLLDKMGFSVSPMGYFYVCNANRNADQFSGILEFEEIIIPYKLDNSWIEKELIEMKSVLDSNKLPEESFGCENCAYNRERKLFN